MNQFLQEDQESQNNQQRYLTKESKIEISNQQPKSEIMRNPAKGLNCGRSTMGLVAWWRPSMLLVTLLILSPFLHNQTPSIKERKGTFQLQTHPQIPTSNPLRIPTTVANPPLIPTSNPL